MMMETDEVAIEKSLWAKVVAGDAEARKQVMSEIDGLVLYMHNLSVSPDTHEAVTLRTLEGMNLLDSVRCYAGRGNGATSDDAVAA